ncbi:2-(3-amino-3-carboxypropyl)histidine synthase subunit 2-like [Halichondria panicea]|uniref:2-(3-amino-3-carboxypropyl)histidine synthase subunit 2-like n=1 Tax=Halichondria panicea TaxID=6063 RepID=UPI00312B6505
MSSVAFSSDGVEVISRQLETELTLGGTDRSREQLEAFYELERCSAFITDNDYHRVALQFPDQYLCDSHWVALRLRETTQHEVFILADTSYGSCCVDEVAADHLGADCIVHFGPSCLTQTRRLPVLYVFGLEAMDVSVCVTAFRQLFTDTEDRILVLYHTSYSHCIGGLEEALTSDYSHCVFSNLVVPVSDRTSDVSMGTEPRTACNCSQGASSDDADSRTCVERDTLIGNKDQVEDTATPINEAAPVITPPNDVTDSTYHRFGREFTLAGPLESYSVFYVGGEGATLNNLMLNLTQCQFYSHDPVHCVSRRETLNINKALGRRYYLMQRAKEARTVGILVGTLGAANYLESIQRLKDMLRRVGKKYYTIAVGKLNIPKMANFLEVDVFVLVACPENSLLDSSQFYKPVVTPYEMEVACNRSRQWGGDYTTDFTELLPGAAFHVPTGDDNELEPEFSLISGSLIPGRAESDEQDISSTALVPRSKMEVAVQKSAAASFLHSRSWQGLEQQLGQTEVIVAAEGISGVAAGYAHEPSEN